MIITSCAGIKTFKESNSKFSHFFFFTQTNRSHSDRTLKKILKIYIFSQAHKMEEHESVLRSFWTRLVLETIGEELRPIGQEWLRKLLALYAEHQRYYHNSQHMAELAQLFEDEEIRGLIRNPTTVALSIFFHDAIYQPTSHDNEEKSEQLFQQFAAECSLGPAITETVSRYILATKRHTEVDTRGDCDLDLFLDLDLAILGAPEERKR